MKKSNGFLSWVYKANYIHDQMESHNRHHTIIQLSFLIMIISLLVPMVICLDTDLDFFRTSSLFFSICVFVACAFRIPYKMGKLDAHMPEMPEWVKKKHKNEKKENYDDWEDVLLNKIYEEMEKEFEALKNKNKNKQNFYNQSSSQPKSQADDWRTPYLKVLGLSASATAEDIKKVYRKLAMQWHPDRNKDPKAEETFKSIKAAYEALC